MLNCGLQNRQKISSDQEFVNFTYFLVPTGKKTLFSQLSPGPSSSLDNGTSFRLKRSPELIPLTSCSALL